MNKAGLGCIVTFIMIIVLGTALYTTCPTTADHSAALSELLNDVLDERIEATDDELVSSVMKIVGRYALNESGSQTLSQMLHVDNYYVVSVGRIRIKNYEQTVSIGVLGHVFTPDKDDIKAELNRYGL